MTAVTIQTILFDLANIKVHRCTLTKDAADHRPKKNSGNFQNDFPKFWEFFDARPGGGTGMKIITRVIPAEPGQAGLRPTKRPRPGPAKRRNPAASTKAATGKFYPPSVKSSGPSCQCAVPCIF